LPGAMPEEVKDQIIDLIGGKREEIIPASGKTGMGIPDILDAIIERVPAPVGDPDAPLQALIFDSVFNSFRGIMAYFKVENGEIRKGVSVKIVSTGKEYYADDEGTLNLIQIVKVVIKTGDIGYIIPGIKEAREVTVGDTITHKER